MKQRTKALLALALFSGELSAASLVKLEAGVGGWMGAFNGELGRDGLSASADTLGLDDEETFAFGYLAIEHPIPLLPNAKIQATDINTSGEGVLSSNFEFSDITFRLNQDVVSNVDLTHADAILYYEILDNWVTLDLGVNFRWFNGELSVTNSAQTLRAFERFDVIVPMGYAKVQLDIPLSGVYAGADISAIGFDGNHHTDFNVKVGYEFETPVLDAGIEIGYRSMLLKLDDVENIDADLDLGGVFLGVNLAIGL